MFVTYHTGLPWVGALGAMAAGALVGLLLAVFCIRYRANQVVTGTAINIFAGGLTVFLLRHFFGAAGTSPQVPVIRDITLPVLSQIFIALAAVIFGKWTPLGALGACLFFGYGDALQMRLQDIGIPTQFMNMLPYVLTMVALAGFIGRAVGPKAAGQPYIKG